MDFIYHYEVSALLFLVISTVYYFGKRVLPTRQNYFYGWLLIGGVCFLAFNIASCILNDYSASLPTWFLYLFNVLLLLLASDLYVALAYIYCVTLIKKQRLFALKARYLLIVPFAVTGLMILTTPWTGWIFYLDEANRYVHGSLHTLLYASSICYLVCIAVAVMTSKKTATTGQRVTMLGFVLIVIAAAVLQFFFPRYMLNGVGIALALQIMMFVLQSPEKYTEPLAGVYTRAAMPLLISYEQERKHTFSVVAYIIDGLGNVNSMVGTQGGDEVLRMLAQELQKLYPRQNICRYASDCYAVVLTGATVNEDSVDEYARNFPRRFFVHDTEVQIDCRTLALPGEEFNSLDSLQFALDQGLEMLRKNGFPGSVFVSDRQADERFRFRISAENRLMDLIAGQRVTVRYLPVFTTDGQISSADTVMTMDDGEGGLLDSDEMYTMADRHGSVIPLNNAMLVQICKFLQRYDIRKWGAQQVFVHLEGIVCSQNDLAAIILRILNRASIDPSLLCFSIMEQDVVRYGDTLEPNMRQLAAAGAGFMLDEYGSGYADLGLLLRLPFSTVKMQQSFIDMAWKQAGGKEFITNLVRLFAQHDISTGCILDDAEDHIAIAQEMGIAFVRTYSAARAMNAETFNDCLADAASARWGK